MRLITQWVHIDNTVDTLDHEIDNTVDTLDHEIDNTVGNIRS